MSGCAAPSTNGPVSHFVNASVRKNISSICSYSLLELITKSCSPPSICVLLFIGVDAPVRRIEICKSTPVASGVPDHCGDHCVTTSKGSVANRVENDSTSSPSSRSLSVRFVWKEYDSARARAVAATPDSREGETVLAAHVTWQGPEKRGDAPRVHVLSLR